MMENINPDELTKEKSLGQVYRQALRIRPSPFNVRWTLIVASSLIIYVIFTGEDTADLTEMLRSWCNLGFNFAVAILGFLIAGFTIFATMTDKSLFVLMAEKKHVKSGLSYLKYNMFTFMSVFVLFIVFAGICLSIIMFAGSKGPMHCALAHLAEFPQIESYIPKLRRVGTSALLVVVGGSFAYLLFLLQSFVFNIYHVIMTSIRWEVEKHDETK